MAKKMTEASYIPAFNYSDEYNVDRLIKLREELNKQYANEIKFSFMPFIIKAVSNSLKEYPELNSVVSEEKDQNGIMKEYTIKSAHNISIAIDSKNGLVVPNIKNVQEKGVKEIQLELFNLIEKAKIDKLSTEDYSDGTFSISNIGNIGGKQLGPVLLPPQVCIIGISRMIDTIKVVNKNDFDEINSSQFNLIQGKQDIGIVFHKSINFCITADHRVLDGAYVARFSQHLRNQIENPIKILI